MVFEVAQFVGDWFEDCCKCWDKQSFQQNSQQVNQHSWLSSNTPRNLAGCKFFLAPNFVSHRPHYTIPSHWLSLVVVRQNLISFEILVQSEEGKEIWPDPPDCRFSAKETDETRRKTTTMMKPSNHPLCEESLKSHFSNQLFFKSLTMSSGRSKLLCFYI